MIENEGQTSLKEGSSASTINKHLKRTSLLPKSVEVSSMKSNLIWPACRRAIYCYYLNVRQCCTKNVVTGCGTNQLFRRINLSLHQNNIRSKVSTILLKRDVKSRNCNFNMRVFSPNRSILGCEKNAFTARLKSQRKCRRNSGRSSWSTS